MKKFKTSMLSLLFTFTIMTSVIVWVLGALFTNINTNFNITYKPSSSVGELWNSSTKKFNSKPMQKLLNKLSGKSETKIDDLHELADSTMTAEDISVNNGEDLVVTLGGLTWHAVYLSKSKSGDIILTLWLENNEQDAWQKKGEEENSNKLGTLHGLAKGPETNKYGLYSDWANDWANASSGVKYPSNMYSTSYIRVVTLNAGGTYSKSGGNALEEQIEQSSDNLFAVFTMSQFGLTPFSVQPKDVAWQETEGSLMLNWSKWEYTAPNEAYGTQNRTNYFSASLNYTKKDKYTDWSEDYIWLPSIAETGYDSSHVGIWKTSQNQRKNYDGSTTGVDAVVGDTSINKENVSSVNTHSWLRSGDYARSTFSHNLNVVGIPSGIYANTGIVYSIASASFAVRPALHLSLSKAVQEADRPLSSEELITEELSSEELSKKEQLTLNSATPSVAKKSLKKKFQMVRKEPARLLGVLTPTLPHREDKPKNQVEGQKLIWRKVCQKR